MTRRARVLMVILLAGVGIGIAYLHVLTRRVSREPAAYGEDVARARLRVAALESEGTPTQTATLYFPSFEHGLLVGEQRPIAWSETRTDRIRQVLLALIEGSHEGRSRSLPASATVRGVFLTPDGTAYLDFSGDWPAELGASIWSECLAVYSVVNSLAVNIPEVQRVRILVQGREVDTLEGHVDVTDYYVPDPTRVMPAS